jgi:hypothetical protein
MLEEALFFVIQAWCFHSHLNPTIMRKTHRGRIQAQGDGLEKSVSWNQDEPLSKADGKKLLQNLKDSLSDTEFEARKEPFEHAERYIDQTNGVQAPEQRTFLNCKTRDVRVDIEVRAGWAFVLLLFCFLFYWFCF